VPELPEVETVRRGLQPAMEGKRVLAVETRRKDLRFPLPERFARRLSGRRILSLDRRAKYLVALIEGGETLVMHLGMTGRFLIEKAGDTREPGSFYSEAGRHPQHDHVVFRMEGDVTVTYNDVRRFGFMAMMRAEEFSTHPLMRDIGVEPLGNAFSAEVLAELFAGKQTPLKAALLDQKLIAGLGNIYVCEALHRARLSPRRMAGSIIMKDGAPTARARSLADEIRLVLGEAIEAGGSTLRDFAHADGSLGYFQHRFKAYDREGEPCSHATCNGVIQRIVQSGRSTFFCARCQK
jgi:formamidopyrimidine-DNA glycosylase